MSFGAWDIAGCDCGCTAAACSQAFTVLGCSSLAYSGVTVNVFASSGGALLATGTTNGSGQVTLSWTGTSTPWVTVTGASTRFAAFGQTLTLTCGGSHTITLSPAAGYVCLLNHACLLPVATTLFLTTDRGNSATLNYAGGSWIGSGTYAYPGCANPPGPCAAVTANVTWQWLEGGSGNINLSANCTGSCPVNPGGTPKGVAGRSGTAVSVTCPPSFQVQTTIPLGDLNFGLWYCGGTGETVTITE